MKTFTIYLALSIIKAQAITIRTHQETETESSTTELYSSSHIPSLNEINNEISLHQRWWFWGGRRHDKAYQLSEETPINSGKENKNELESKIEIGPSGESLEWTSSIKELDDKLSEQEKEQIRLVNDDEYSTWEVDDNDKKESLIENNQKSEKQFNKVKPTETNNVQITSEKYI